MRLRATAATLLQATTLVACAQTGPVLNASAPRFDRVRGDKALHDRIVYSFKGGADGSDPWGTLRADTHGDLFGTTQYGGGSCNCGTVFELAPSGATYKEKWRHSFEGGNDGANPIAGLIIENGALYGTTIGGGPHGVGTVFKISESGTGYKQIYAFAGDDGQNPGTGTLAAGNGGVLYGTTYNGGTAGNGTIFELKPSGKGYKESLLHSFQGSDGAHPWSGVALVKSALYSMPSQGDGSGVGGVFKILLSGKPYTLLSFNNTDGGYPDDTPGIGSDGNFYGTTALRGSANLGVVFDLAPRGTSYTGCFQSFTGSPDDGANPWGGLVADGSVFYGATEYGGYSNDGTIFKFTYSGPSRCSETPLYSFQGGNDASYPIAGLTLVKGTLFGAGTQGGGGGNYGAVFALTP